MQPAPELSHDAEARIFYNAALSRIQRTIAVLAGVGTVLTAFMGFRVAVPFAAGALLAYLNFQWLARSTQDLLARVVALSQAEGSSQNLPRGGSAVAKFALRYALIGLAAYVIFKSSLFSLLGLFAGLSLPIAALMVEAAYEVWVSYRRGL